MMNVMIKHMVEIAGGLVVGSLASDGLNKAIKIVAKKVKDSKKK